MNATNSQNSVSVKTLMFAALRKWKTMVAVALILAVLLGGAQGYLTWISITDPEKLAAQQANYENTLKEYEKQYASLQAQMETTRDHIWAQQDYLEESILMRIDPRNVYTAKLTLFVAAEENAQWTESKNNAMVLAYAAGLMDQDVLETVAEQVGVETKYLSELIEVSTGGSDSTMSHILSVTVRHYEKESAELIMDAIQGQLTEIGKLVRTNIGKHTLGVVVNSIGVVVDAELAETQRLETDRLSQYNTELEATEKEQKNLRKPAEVEFSTAAVVKKTIVYAIVGAVLGVFLVAVAVWVAFVTGDKVYSGEEIKKRFGIRLLGCISFGKKRQGINAWLDRAEGRRFLAGKDVELAAANLRNLTAGTNILLIAGSADESHIAHLAQLLREKLPEKQILAGGCLLQNVDALEKLPGCDGVVLVETCNESRYSGIAEEMEVIQSVKKPLVGVIAVEV